jgi:hypothetical protein
MADKIKFGYIKVSGLTAEILKFDKAYLNGGDKFIQVKINGEDYIRIGDSYHRSILRNTLNEFGLEFDMMNSSKGDSVPSIKGKDYEMVGAGKIMVLGDELNFYDTSSDYMLYVSGANRGNLEKIFGKENLNEEEEGLFGPSFLVKIPEGLK